MAELLLHIGYRKTGSTLIQTSFFESKSELLAREVVYSSMTGHPNHEEFACAFPGPMNGEAHRRLGITDPLSRSAHRRKMLRELEAEVAKNPKGRFVISSEQFMGLYLNQAGIEMLSTVLQEYFEDIQVYCYLRNPADYLVSNYSTQLKTGKRNHRFRLDDAEQFPSLESETAPWLKHFENVNFRYYRRDLLKNHDLLADFIDWTALDSSVSIKIGLSNKSLGLAELEFLRLLNQTCPKFGAADHVKRRSIIRRLESLSSKSTPAKLSPSLATKILKKRWQDVEHISDLTKTPIETVSEMTCVAENGETLESYRLPKNSMEHIALDLLQLEEIS